jgi:hypothetical protein
VRRRTDRQKFGQAFHNAEQNGLNIRVQEASRAGEPPGRCRRRERLDLI